MFAHWLYYSMFNVEIKLNIQAKIKVQIVNDKMHLRDIKQMCFFLSFHVGLVQASWLNFILENVLCFIDLS